MALIIHTRVCIFRLDEYQGDSTVYIAILPNMDEETAKVACGLHELEPEKLTLVRRWLDELEGQNRKDAFELLNLVMTGSISNDEAFVLLDKKHD